MSCTARSFRFPAKTEQRMLQRCLSRMTKEDQVMSQYQMIDAVPWAEVNLASPRQYVCCYILGVSGHKQSNLCVRATVWYSLCRISCAHIGSQLRLFFAITCAAMGATIARIKSLWYAPHGTAMHPWNGGSCALSRLNDGRSSTWPNSLRSL